MWLYFQTFSDEISQRQPCSKVRWVYRHDLLLDPYSEIPLYPSTYPSIPEFLKHLVPLVSTNRTLSNGPIYYYYTTVTNTISTINTIFTLKKVEYVKVENCKDFILIKF